MVRTDIRLLIWIRLQCILLLKHGGQTRPNATRGYWRLTNQLPCLVASKFQGFPDGRSLENSAFSPYYRRLCEASVSRREFALFRICAGSTFIKLAP